jgi:hypothetical protein
MKERKVTVVVAADNDYADQYMTGLMLSEQDLDDKVGDAGYTTALTNGELKTVSNLIRNDYELDRNVYLACNIKKLWLLNINQVVSMPPHYKLHIVINGENVSDEQVKLIYDSNDHETFVLRKDKQ